VRIAPLINTLSVHLILSDVRLLTHTLTPGLDIWSVDINSGWPTNGNLIACGPADHGGGSDTILETVVGPNTIPQNRLVR